MTRTTIHTKGFTLIEVMLYVAIASTMLFVVVQFLHTLVAGRIHQHVIAEVEFEGAQTLTRVLQTTRNAEVLNTPAVGGTGTTLSVDTYVVGNNPTTFYVAGGVLYTTEGSSAPKALTSNVVTVSDFAVTNATAAGSAGIARVVYTLTYTNPENRPEYTYQKTFIGSAALRKQP